MDKTTLPLTEMAQEMNVTPEVMQAFLGKWQDQGVLLAPGLRGGDVEAARAFVQLGRVAERQLSPDVVPEALDTGVSGLLRTLEMSEDVPADPATAPSRPKREGLLQMMASVISSKDRFDKEMFLAEIPTDPLRARGRFIGIARGISDVLTFACQVVEYNLALAENQVVEQVQPEYDKVRVAARAKLRFGRWLREAEQYFYGSQKQAADTRARNLELRKEVEGAAGRVAQAQAETRVRRQVAEDFSALLKDMVTQKERDPEGGAAPGEGEFNPRRGR